MLPLLAAVFYFLIIRPESKRKKAAAKLRNELIVGDEITTIGGLVGRVVAIKDDAVTLETGADKVKIKIMRWAISSKGAQPAE
ncbi:MAG: preprotein translocase subunit YajC [Oscillospiraceae bacterium]|nr:preprotein translocase subunit YajC [Oscillospiraceae bacterium]